MRLISRSIIYILLFTIHNIFCDQHRLNIDTQHAFLMNKNIKGNKGLFGFSSALAEDELFVGAPHHDEKGAIFKCNLDNENHECSTIDRFKNKGRLCFVLGVTKRGFGQNIIRLK